MCRAPCSKKPVRCWRLFSEQNVLDLLEDVYTDGAEEWWYSDTILGEGGAGGALASCTKGNAPLVVTAINALPALIEVVEAAREWHKAKMVLRESDVDTNAQAAMDYYVASDGLSAALAKLEGE
jgi:hypothetical protein